MTNKSSARYAYIIFFQFPKKFMMTFINFVLGYVWWMAC